MHARQVECATLGLSSRGQLGLDEVQYTMLEWIACFNTCLLIEPSGYLPPAEYEARPSSTHSRSHQPGSKRSTS